MTRRGILTLVIVAAALSLALIGGSALRGQAQPQFSADVIAALSGGDIEGFARVTGVKAFSFPRDHGAHPEYQTEWWYNTANVQTADGRRFGLKFTIFRRALTPTMPERASEWATNQVYFADFAIADIAADRFYFKERFARGAADLAGAQSEPYAKIWIEDWSITFDEDGQGYRLRAAEGELSMDVRLRMSKPIVFHGDRGFSVKNKGEGNASYYYSFTRSLLEGTIAVRGEQFAVSGTAWFDHEYSTSVLGEDALGWDWFSLQLDDGREIMLYQIRLRGGGIEPTSHGTFIDADGSTYPLSIAAGDYTITPLGTWTSPHTGAVYPHGWRLTVQAPDGLIELDVQPFMRDQELNTTTAYYEGAVRLTGTQNGAPISGVGYVELTGYNVQTREGYSR